MKVSAIHVCTVGVSDLDHSLALFRDAMKLRVEREGEFSSDELRAYRLPPTTTARFFELSAAGYPVGRLRLVHYLPQAEGHVRSDHDGGDSGTDVGSKAIDFYVANPIAPRVAEIERAGYVFRSPPVRHLVGETESEECLFSGPDGVPVLIMVGHRHRDVELRPGCLSGPYSEIATISVVTASPEASRAFYEDVLGWGSLADAETGAAHQASVNNLTGVPAGTRVRFCLYAAAGEASGKILIVHFFERTGKRLVDRMRPGRLGFSLMTHACDDIDALHARLLAGGYTIFTPPTSVRTGGAERRVLLAKGPNEELFEFMEER
jgi:catechol 2,3-dioxygenase-like lactoylglutathione lyase family enzyme